MGRRVGSGPQGCQEVTALSPVVGYDKASKIAHRANDEGTTLGEAALKEGVAAELFDKTCDPKTMIGHGLARLNRGRTAALPERPISLS